MGKQTPRMGRVSDVLHRNLATLIRDDFKDPRAGFITISDVEVSRDLSHAKVYVTVFEDDKISDTVEVLNKASGFFRSELSHRVKLRSIPQLKFIYDTSLAEGNKIEALLAEQKKKHDEP